MINYTEETFAYDSTGNLLDWTNGRGETVTKTYNSRGQVTSKAYPDGRLIEYQYDAMGNLTSATDSLTGAISMEYDARGFLTRIDYPNTHGFVFEYNNAGRRTKRTSHDGFILNYHYNTGGKLERLTDGSGKELIRYEYNPNGLLKGEYKGNGTRVTYSYDGAGRILNVIHYSPDDSAFARFDYTYNLDGNCTSLVTPEGTIHYTYDAAGQLISAVPEVGTSADSITYAYDTEGNRDFVDREGTLVSYMTNEMNQYTQAGSVTYDYDLDGDMISKSDSHGITNCFYDAEKRLTKVVTPSLGTWEYTYDGLGNLVESKHNGISTYFVSDPNASGDLAAEYDHNGALAVRYTWGRGLVCQLESTGTKRYYAFDGGGNTRHLTDETGTVVNSYDYTPFGIPTLVDETVSNRFRFVGRSGGQERGHGLVSMGARFYDSDMGRFISPDPIGQKGGFNLYLYAANNPLKYSDPTGLFLDNIKRFFKKYIWDDGGIPLSETGERMERSVKVKLGRPSRWDAEGIIQWQNESKQVGKDLEPTLEFGSEQASLLNNLINTLSAGGSELGALAAEFHQLLDALLRGIVGQCEKEISGNGMSTMEDTTGCVLVPMAEDESEVITPEDPNEKAGPGGIGEERYITAGETMTYTVYFENKPTASASAQEVFVDDYLDSDLDWSTFRLGEISFGEHLLSSLAGHEAGEDQILIGDNLMVLIDAQRFPGTGLVNWTFRTRDVTTGDWPEDPYAGFLPPEDGTGRGQGYVTFTLKARDDLSAGTVITNAADIVFDTNAAITTNEVFNTVSDAAPIGPIAPGVNDSATDVPVSTVLSWTPCDFATSYDITLWESGTSKPAAPTASGLQSPFYEPIILNYDTAYLWQVTARNVVGGFTGPEWAFSTAPDPDACIGNTDGDGDVDGSDLATFADNPGGVSIEDFALHYSRTDCP